MQSGLLFQSVNLFQENLYNLGLFLNNSKIFNLITCSNP